MFIDGNTSEFDTTVADLVEKNGALTKKVRNLKVKQEVQSIFLCEVTEKKKKAEEDKVMIEDEKRIVTKRLEEKTLEVNRISHMQLETMNQMIIFNDKLNENDNEITNLNF